MTDAAYQTPSEAIGPEETTPSLRQRATAIVPMIRPAIRYVPKNPLFLIGAAALGVAGFMAWKNRDRIRARAEPMLQSAAARGAELKEQAIAKGSELKDMAMEKGAELAQHLPFGRDAMPEQPVEPPIH
jgi:hypothetical protein